MNGLPAAWAGKPQEISIPRSPWRREKSLASRSISRRLNTSRAARNRSMQIEPDFAAFERKYREGRPQSVFERRIADLETPVSAYLKLAQSRDNAFLLESVQGGETRGRYSVIGIEPDLVWRCRDGQAEVAHGEAGDFGPAEFAERPLQSLRTLVRDIGMEMPQVLP